MRVSDAAKTIAREANEMLGSSFSGLMVFRPDGSGGALYTEGTSVAALQGDGNLVLPVNTMAHHLEPYTPEWIQELLDELA